MVALLSALGIPISMVAPNVPARHHRMLLSALAVCYVVAYAGLGLAPVGGAWVWMVLTGIGSGMFPVALTMIGLRSRTPETTAALSAFMQSIGYIVAGAGPLLFGVLFGATGSWTLPLTLLFVALGLAWIAGWWAASPRFVDDEVREDLAVSIGMSELRRHDFAVLRDLPTRWSDDDTYGHVNNVVHYLMFDTAVNGWLIEAVGHRHPAAAGDRARGRDLVPVLRRTALPRGRDGRHRAGAAGHVQRRLPARAVRTRDDSSPPRSGGSCTSTSTGTTRRPVPVPPEIRAALATL